MDILWDGRKNRKLKATRGVSFEGYTYVVPFVIDAGGNMILKTIFPSRKFHRLQDQGR